jgi:guanylate kinase
MKYLIIGRSGTGKDTLARMLADRGLKILKSYSTREPRYKGEDTHIFISKEDAAKITDKIATTTINNNEYFATRKQLDECDVYIIDPNGFDELTANCPDISFHAIYMATNKDIAKERAAHRSKDAEKESAIYDSRYESENEQFTNFEERLKDKTKPLAENCCAVHYYTNEGSKEQIDNFAGYLFGLLQEFKNLLYITEQSVNLGILNQSEIGHVDVSYIAEDNNVETKSKPYELFVDLLLAENEGYQRLIHSYLASVPIYDDIEPINSGAINNV